MAVKWWLCVLLYCIYMVVFITTAAAIYSLGHRLCTFTAVLMSTQPSTLCGTVKWVSADWLINNNNGEVGVDGSCQSSANSHPKLIGLVWGLAATRRSVYIHQMNRVKSHHSMFTGRTLYVTPNQHCQRTKVSKKSAVNTEPTLMVGGVA